MLRWQRCGTASHAVDGDHQPVAGELIRTLCDACIEIGDRDVQPYDPEPLGLACLECGEIWADMEGVSAVDTDGLRNTYTNAKGEQIDLDTGDAVDDEEQDR